MHSSSVLPCDPCTHMLCCHVFAREARAKASDNGSTAVSSAHTNQQLGGVAYTDKVGIHEFRLSIQIVNGSCSLML